MVTQVTYSNAFLAAATCAIALWLIRPVAIRFDLIDYPDDDRKQHDGSVPLIGGICIYLGVMSTLLLPNVDNPVNFFIYVSVLFLAGVWDDLKAIAVAPRIYIQLLVALLVCLLDDHLVTYLGNITGTGQIGTSVLAIPITVLAIVTAINAFNMLDGIDGLAASIALVSFVCLGLIFYEEKLWVPFGLCVSFIASLIPFLLCNLQVWPFKKKAFLSDSGSIVIGFAIVWLLIYGSQPEDRSLPEIKAFYPVTALWIIGLPLFDLMSVCIRRIKRGQSPVAGDRDQIHHILLSRGFRQSDCLSICIFFEIALSVTGLVFDFSGLESLSFVIFWVAFIIYHLIASKYSQASTP
jgi:UDP-GlcNAc:undecaprenyl-phosphate/decaprenyl-phosphate GlcNAc-1-phosphate transferase